MTSSSSSSFWDNYRQAHPCIIDQLFVGQLQQTVVCKQCGNRSVSSVPFKDIPLAITKSIQQSIAQYFASESLDADERYSCVVCQTLTNAKIKKKFMKLPPYLIFQVKRFQESAFSAATGGIGFRKDKRPIEYPPLLDLDQ